MNSILSTERAHVSVRRFRPDPVGEALLRDCLSAAQHAASSHNVQAYSVLRVRDPSQRAELAALAGAQRQVVEAPVLLMVCADSRRHRLLCERAGRAYLANLETFLVSVIDAALFAQNLALGLESEGLSTCFIGGMRNDLEHLDRILGVPHGVFPLFGLCAGTAADVPPQRERLPLEAIYHEGAWPSDAELLAAIERGDAASREAYAARGKAGHTWSSMVARLFAQRERDAIGAYYRRKGADLD